MNYEQRYKDILEAVKKMQEANPHDEGLQNWINDYFPELAESEDEKIRKTIIRFFEDQYSNETGMYDGSVTVGKAVAWLEKQGEQKSDGNEEDEKIRQALIRFHKSTIDIDGIKGSEIVSWLEKQGKGGEE